MEITFENLCSVIRESCGLDREVPITTETQFRRDLGIIGDDGDGLLKDVEKAFGIKFSRESFELGPYEFLFDSEGPDVIGPIWRMITRKPEPEVRSFTVAELYAAVIKEHTRHAEIHDKARSRC